jgi:hypothetical protein
MRHPLGKLPEILDAYSRDGLYFAAIRLLRNDADRVFELGICEPSYFALRRVLQMRPFDPTPGLKYRYLFDSAHSKRDDPNRCIATVRIEQGREGKGFEAELPKQLIANMLWFYEMKDHESAAHLRSWPYEST